jgi:hypothetical protein
VGNITVAGEVALGTFKYNVFDFALGITFH